ncbi:MAG: hypothetical protein GY941_28935, partial [Planctomycetes bacterium]|nr:hypothetical protein [Planctomycetota bacterium]
FQIRSHIRELEELEYIYSVSGKKGKEYVYELMSTSDGDAHNLIGQIDIEELKAKAVQAGIPIE